jgi:hypothetical protein
MCLPRRNVFNDNFMFCICTSAAIAFLSLFQSGFGYLYWPSDKNVHEMRSGACMKFVHLCGMHLFCGRVSAAVAAQWQPPMALGQCVANQVIVSSVAHP